MIFNVNDGELYGVEAGEGRTIVLIHGNAQDTRTWKNQMDVFSLGYHVLAYDIRGTGQSSRLPGREFSHVADLEGILNSKGILDVYLVGMSLGGLIAMNFAFEHKHRVKGMVLASSDLAGGPTDENYIRFLASLKLAMRTGGAEKVTNRYLNSPLLKIPMSNPKVAKLIKEMVSGYQWELFAEDAPSGIIKTITRLDLAEVKTPTLVLHGADDIEKFQMNSKILSSEIRDAGLVAIEDCGHFPHLEAPEVFNSQIIRFLESLK